MEDYKKKYEGSMKNIERLHESVGPKCKQIIEYYFPELKESEDEKIRKGILNFLKEFECNHYRNLDFSSWIAWLEKQGEQKFPSLSEKEIVCLKRILDFLRKEHNSYTGEDFTNEIAVLEWLITHPVLIYSSELQQNQDKQKPAWSEEDEEMYIQICNDIDYLSRFTDRCDINLFHKKTNWLKSLKERVKGE